MPRSLVPAKILALSSDPSGSVVVGTTYYNTTSKTLRTYNGTAWGPAVPTSTATATAGTSDADVFALMGVY